MKVILSAASLIASFSFVATGLVFIWGILLSDFTLALSYGTLSATWFTLMVIFSGVKRDRYTT